MISFKILQAYAYTTRNLIENANVIVKHFAKNKRRFDGIIGKNRNRPRTTHGHDVRNNLAEIDRKPPGEFGESPCTPAKYMCTHVIHAIVSGYRIISEKRAERTKKRSRGQSNL